MTPEQAQLSAAGDGMITAYRINGEATAAYYMALRKGGLPAWYAIRLTLEFVRASMASATVRALGNQS